MKKKLEKYEIEEIDIKMLFAVLTWGFLLILSPLLKIICNITNIYKVNLIYMILINLCLCTIGFILFKIYKYLSLKFNLFLKIYIEENMQNNNKAIEVHINIFSVFSFIIFSPYSPRFAPTSTNS